MATVQNSHTLHYGTEHGCIGIGVCNTYSNQIDAVKISNGPDAGRHYIRMQETGSKEDGSKGSTHIAVSYTHLRAHETIR